MGWGKLGTIVLCFCLFTTHLNTSFAAADSCGKTIAEADEEKALMVFAADAAKECPDPNACVPSEALAKELESVVEKNLSPEKRTLVQKILLFPRRTALVTLWGSCIVGSGLLTFLLTKGMDQAIRSSMMSISAVISSILFGRLISPLDRTWGQRIVEKNAFWLWGAEDKFGRVMSQLSDDRRLVVGQIGGQLNLIRDNLQKGADSLMKHHIDESARQYATAVLLSVMGYAGIPLKDRMTLLVVRTYLPQDLSGISLETKTDLIEKAIRYVNSRSEEELPKDQPKEKTLQVVKETLSFWFGV